MIFDILTYLCETVSVVAALACAYCMGRVSGLKVHLAYLDQRAAELTAGQSESVAKEGT
jgi:hypothetical protein